MKRVRVPRPELIPLGEKVRALRKAGNLTQREVARRVPITVWFLQEIESGRAAPTAPILKKVLNAIDPEIRVDDVLRYVESRYHRVNRLFSKHKKIIRQRAGQLYSEELDFEDKELYLKQLGLLEE